MAKCAYCNTVMIGKSDGELHCPKRRWYTLGLHTKTMHGYYAYPADYDSFISYLREVRRRSRYIFL